MNEMTAGAVVTSHHWNRQPERRTACASRAAASWSPRRHRSMNPESSRS